MAANKIQKFNRPKGDDAYGTGPFEGESNYIRPFKRAKKDPVNNVNTA